MLFAEPGKPGEYRSGFTRVLLGLCIVPRQTVVWSVRHAVGVLVVALVLMNWE